MICKIDNCGQKAIAKGFCRIHYYRMKRGVPLNQTKNYHPSNPLLKCRVEGCNKYTPSAVQLCNKHYRRWKDRIPMAIKDLRIGDTNWNWNGGIAEYPNQNLMRKNRLVKIGQQHVKCEICGHKGDKIHHKDGSKDNHKIDNLMLLCIKCHYRIHRGRKNKVKTRKWIRLYGMTQAKLCKQLNCSYYLLIEWHKADRIKFLLEHQKKC
jgi:hypothetical protein